MREERVHKSRKSPVILLLIVGFLISLLSWLFFSLELRFRQGSLVMHTKIPDRIPLPEADRLYGLSKGKFLVATENVRDPRFMETVILLIKHDRSGSMGLIINRPLEVKLHEIFPGVEGLQNRDDLVYFGGPVNLERALILLRSVRDHEESSHIFGSVYNSDSMNLLKRLATTDKKGKDHRVYIGYSGWAAGQLEQEFSKDDWRVLKADAEIIFDRPSAEVWPELIRRGTSIQAQGEQGVPQEGMLSAVQLFQNLFR